jgi:predicted protein tyrosine phosphatase
MVRSLVPFDVTICGIPDLDKFRDAKVTHVLSIIDPQEPEPGSFRFYPSHERLTLRFDDVVGAYPGFQAPERGDLKKLLDFGQSLQSSGQDGHLLVHCHAGVSRSTAATDTSAAIRPYSIMVAPDRSLIRRASRAAITGSFEREMLCCQLLIP